MRGADSVSDILPSSPSRKDQEPGQEGTLRTCSSLSSDQVRLGKRKAEYDGTQVEVQSEPPPEDVEDEDGGESEDEDEPPSCLICLGEVEDMAILPHCKHACFCFECIVKWATLKRRCPLCNQDVGPFIIHSVRSQEDYLKHSLRPLHLEDPLLASQTSVAIEAASSSFNPVASSSEEGEDLMRLQLAARIGRNRWRTTRSGLVQGQRDDEERRRKIEHKEMLRVDRALRKRKEIYRLGLYAKHVGSNRHTRYRPPPTPSQIASSPDIQSSLAAFIRRDLYSWPNLDVEFLTTYSVSIMKTMEISSEESLTLLSEFLGPTGSRHFAHEVEMFLRSGKRELKGYDTSPWLQYDFESVIGSSNSGVLRGTKQKRSARSGEARPTTSSSSGRYRCHRSDGTASLQDRLDGGDQQQPKEKVQEQKRQRDDSDMEGDVGPSKERIHNEQGLQDGDGVSARSASPPPPPIRDEVIGLRAKLLSRLEQEKLMLSRESPGPGGGAKDSATVSDREPSSSGVADHASQSQNHVVEEGDAGFPSDPTRLDPTFQAMRDKAREARLKSVLSMRLKPV